MRWMWIDRIVEYQPEQRLVAIKNVSMAEDHLSDHFGGDPAVDQLPVQPASLMIEGMAQSAGLLVGAARQFREKVILAKIVRAEIERDVSPGESIRYEAIVDRIDDVGASTHGAVSRMRHHGDAAGQWERIGSIDLLFSHIDRNMQGLEFPEENFVFADNFKLILRISDLGHLAPA